MSFDISARSLTPSILAATDGGLLFDLLFMKTAAEEDFEMKGRPH